MNNTITSVANAVSVGINAEVRQCLEDARNNIHEREIAREYVNTHLDTMPVITGGTHLVSYRDNRGFARVKEQDKNLSLWCVVLQTVIESGDTTTTGLGAMLRDWATNTINVSWDVDASKRVAKRFITGMQQLGILDETRTSKDIIDEESKLPITIKVFALSPSFLGGAYKSIKDCLLERASMKCKPLYHEPMDWTAIKAGVGDDANMKLINGLFAKTPSNMVLSAVNKLQQVVFTVPACMIDTANDLLDNQDELTSVEDLRLYEEVLKYEGQNFHFAITMDWRGRMYYRGGMLSPQGNDFCKACFQFATPQRLGETGLRAIAIHTANVLGYDKCSLQEREEVVMAYIDSGTFDGIHDHVDVLDAFPKADKYQALVAITELKRILLDVDAGATPSECWSTLVCHQDGTCNGLQHMAAITKNRATAESVNCVLNTEDLPPKDIYGMVADYAASNTLGDVHDLIVKYGRGMAKTPVMVTGYGAGEDTIKNGVRAYLAEKGEATTHASAIGDAYIAAINANAGAVKRFTGAMKSRVKRAIERGQTRFAWTTPDGFVCDREYLNDEHKLVRAGVFNAILKNKDEVVFDDVKTIGAMSPNFIHSLDATHLRMVVNNAHCDLVTVHDSIGCHPSNFFHVNKVIREQFVELHQHDTVSMLCSAMGERAPKFRGDYDVKEAMYSPYIFS